MLADFFSTRKKEFEDEIPEYDSAEFRKLRDEIKRGLAKKENELLWLVRRQKILLLGDWYTPKKKGLLESIKTALLSNGLYAETLDNYYNIKKEEGLSQPEILEHCCIRHQLIVFIDGDGKGTLTEQNYLRETYPFHKKLMFFIEEKKFQAFKDKPSEYVGDFATIIPYKKKNLTDTVITFSRLRIYRLARIITRQLKEKKGPQSPLYKPWKRRLLGKN